MPRKKAIETPETTDQPKKRGPGRPKGSKNKSKARKAPKRQPLKRVYDTSKRKHKIRAQKAAVSRKLNTRAQQVVSLKDQLIKKQVQLLQARINHLHDRLMVIKNDNERTNLLNVLESVNTQLIDALAT